MGPGFAVLEFDVVTHTAADAAAAIGCDVAQIAKSLIFRAASGQHVLVIASGTNRVDEKAVGALLGQKISRADAQYVRERTGYAIGGIPPVGHASPPITLIDTDLFRYDSLWAGAGTPSAVVQLTPADLLRLTGGQRAVVAKAPPEAG